MRSLIGSWYAALPRVAVLPLCVACFVACSDPTNTESPLHGVGQPISGGQVDHTTTGVFGMFVHHGEAASICSGALLAPNLLLTAQHCVAQTDSGPVECGDSAFGSTVRADTLFVSNDVALSDESRWYAGSEIVVPSEGNDTCGFDIALVILAENVPSTVANFLFPRLDDVVSSGDVFTAIGYGVTGDQPDDFAGVRMVAGGRRIICVGSECGQGVETSEFLGDSGPCDGDSGGPALDASGRVIGVLSRGSDPCATPIYGSVAAWRDFIRDVGEQAAEEGGYAPPAWLTPGAVVEPDPVDDPVPDPDEEIPGHQGAACDGSNACAAGHACFYNTVPEEAFCARLCQDDSVCGDLTCDGQHGVCVEPEAGVEESSGCALASASRPSPGGAGAGLLMALGVLAFSRRRRLA